jgi:hypothetical protein
VAEGKDSFHRLLGGKDHCGERKVGDNVGAEGILRNDGLEVFGLLGDGKKSWCGNPVFVSLGEGCRFAD